MALTLTPTGSVHLLNSTSVSRPQIFAADFNLRSRWRRRPVSSISNFRLRIPSRTSLHCLCSSSSASSPMSLEVSSPKSQVKPSQFSSWNVDRSCYWFCFFLTFASKFWSVSWLFDLCKSVLGYPRRNCLECGCWWRVLLLVCEQKCWFIIQPRWNRWCLILSLSLLPYSPWRFFKY